MYVHVIENNTIAERLSLNINYWLENKLEL